MNFIKKIKKGNIRLLLDTGNLELEKMDLKKVFSKNQKIIEHVQLSNKNLNETQFKKIQKQIKFLKNMKFKKLFYRIFIKQRKKYNRTEKFI